MKIETESWQRQRELWPASGRHILAAYDEHSVLVYQAYRPEIGAYALEHQRFGGPWSFSRMSWIKPNFLWMMYRSGWGQKPGQEVVLAIRIAREGFDAILAAAVHSSHVPAVYGEQAEWKRQLQRSQVRLQWDPDHDPHGQKCERRAIQLGLRGEFLRNYAERWCLGITDVSALAREQHAHVQGGRLNQLETPRERVYPVRDAAVAAKLGLDAWDHSRA